MKANPLADEGFTTLPSGLPAEAIATMRAACEETLARKNRSRTWFPRELVHRHPYDEILAEVARLAAPCLTGEPRRTELWIRAATPGRPPGGIHRDGRALTTRPETITADLLLTDFTADNGATWYWPGSHLLPDQDVDDLRATTERAAVHPSVQLIAPAGTLVVRDNRTWHQSGHNRTGQIRLMLSSAFYA